MEQNSLKYTPQPQKTHSREEGIPSLKLFKHYIILSENSGKLHYTVKRNKKKIDIWGFKRP